MGNKTYKQIITIILFHFALLSNAQYSYDILIETPADEKAEFVYHDELNNEEIVVTEVQTSTILPGFYT